MTNFIIKYSSRNMDFYPAIRMFNPILYIGYYILADYIYIEWTVSWLELNILIATNSMTNSMNMKVKEYHHTNNFITHYYIYRKL